MSHDSAPGTSTSSAATPAVAPTATPTLTPGSTIGWIGTGVMGEPMARHLMDAGYRLRIFTRTRERADALVAAGASWAATPAAAADDVDVCCSMVGFPSDVAAVHLAEDGTLAAAVPPRAIIDFTTSRPALAEQIAEAAATRGVLSVDAPVSGGDVGARNASLSIMVGGSDAAVGFVRPLFDPLGATIVHQGPAGAGQHTKMVNQTLIASGMIGACEGLLYAARAGLDPERVIESVAVGAAGSWTISNLGPRMLRRDFAPGFYVEHFIKDLGIALDEASRLGLALPGLALARQLYEAVRAQGHGRAGTQALLLGLEHLNAIEPTAATAAPVATIPATTSTTVD
ncbi:MAG: NAD(P)-dependent oxidoreductase [Phycisphaerales bacterium]